MASRTRNRRAPSVDVADPSTQGLPRRLSSCSIRPGLRQPSRAGECRMVLWIGVGLGVFCALSVLVAAALAAMLRTISIGVTEMHEELFDVSAVEPPALRRRSRPRRRRLELELHP